MPLYVTCIKCNNQMAQQSTRVCPVCVERMTPKERLRAEHMRDYWRQRRANPEIRARDLTHLRERLAAQPIEERRAYVRKKVREWRTRANAQATERAWRQQPEVVAKKLAWHLQNYGYHYELRRRLRENVLEEYGGRCACCGETRYEFLAIDHIAGDGGTHRKTTKGPIDRWLKANGYPKQGFRILCHNCNMARGLYGYCPHECPQPQTHGFSQASQRSARSSPRARSQASRP